MSAILHALANSTPIDEDAESIFNGLEYASKYLAEHAKKGGIAQINVLLLGGASLKLNGYRDTFNDVDIRVKEIQLKAMLPSTLLRSGPPPRSIEICFDNKIAQLEDPLAFDRSETVVKQIHNGVEVSLSVYPEAFFLLRKMSIGREKCLPDVHRMLLGISHLEIIEAFNKLAEVNRAWVMNDLADMLVTDYAMLSRFANSQADKLVVLKDVCEKLSVDQDKRKDITSIYRHMCHDDKIKSKKMTQASTSVEPT
jgi:hypothetical protein